LPAWEVLLQFLLSLRYAAEDACVYIFYPARSRLFLQPSRAAVAEEFGDHPRIATAIKDLEDAVAYMEAAPHNFGGHKAAAIAASRKAIVQLRKAMAYRARRDGK
jgi:hypothetical protein